MDSVMKKLFAYLILTSVCCAAFAQDENDSDSRWSVGTVDSFLLYNYNIGIPEGMQGNGYGMDFNLLDVRYNAWRGGNISLGVLDLSLNYCYPDKGLSFNPDGTILRVASDNVKKSYLNDISFTFPIGISQEFGSSKLGFSLYVAPGFGWASYYNDIVTDGIRTKVTYSRVKEKIEFRLQAKAVFWYDDLGVMLRYCPLAVAGENGPRQSFSIGLCIKY